MRVIYFAALLFATSATAQQPPLVPVTFDWPLVVPDAIPDLRITKEVDDARESARSATSRANEGRRAAAVETRRAGLQGALGLKPNRATTDDGTTIAATRGATGGGTLGTITYSSGASMRGAFGPDIGVYTGAPESSLMRFSGWVWGAARSAATPRDGIFEWRNGDIFTGSIIGSGRLSRGIYIALGGQQQFIGVVDLSQTQFRPVRGYMKDSAGRLLAVVVNR